MRRDLTHFSADGRARMVHIGSKTETEREAVAQGVIMMAPETLTQVLAGQSKKGNPVPVAELAGIMGAKRTADLIPLCHPLSLTGVNVTILADSELPGFRVEARVATRGRTGVEMEALTAVCTACLTLYDMLKAIDRTMMIGHVALIEKTGGSSDDFQRQG